MLRRLSALGVILAAVLVSVAIATSTLAGGSAYVRGATPWNFGMIEVTEGATYDVTARGFVHTAKIAYYHDPGVSMSANGPGGQANSPCLADYESVLNGDCQIEGANFGALIGIVVDPDTFAATSEPFLIGAATSFRAPGDGWLFLGINDLTLSYSDNTGQFTVVVTPR